MKIYMLGLSVLPVLGSLCGVAHAGHWTLTGGPPTIIQSKPATTVNMTYTGPWNTGVTTLSQSFTFTWSKDFMTDYSPLVNLGSNFVWDGVTLSANAGSATYPSAGFNFLYSMKQIYGGSSDLKLVPQNVMADSTTPTNTTYITAGSHLAQAVIGVNAGSASFTNEIYTSIYGGGTTGSSTSRSASMIGLDSIGLYAP